MAYNSSIPELIQDLLSSLQKQYKKDNALLNGPDCDKYIRGPFGGAIRIKPERADETMWQFRKLPHIAVNKRNGDGT